MLEGNHFKGTIISCSLVMLLFYIILFTWKFKGNFHHFHSEAYFTLIIVW